MLRAAEEEFSEGEPELHAPEEDLVELDEESVLEQELDAEELLEEDVDDRVLQETLEDLEVQEPEPAEGAEAVEVESGEEEIEEPTGPEDVETTLDEVLAERLAGEGPEGWVDVEPVSHHRLEDEFDLVAVPGRQPGEFLCRGCFLLRRPEMLVDGERMLCRDCAS